MFHFLFWASALGIDIASLRPGDVKKAGVGHAQRGYIVSPAEMGPNLRDLGPDAPENLKNILKRGAKYPPRGTRCAQDFTAPCPSYFEQLFGYCVDVPGQTSSNCVERINAAQTPSQRAKLAFECKVRWPCGGLGPGDLDQDLCPPLWSLEGPPELHTCAPTADYPGPCKSAVQFLGWSDWEHRYWRVRCGL